ncbi:MAG: cytochrome oxidase [Gemmatimonadaceae bacterium]|nr:cytochrome oxidase [Gemmatimonadaceae bacterium]
MTIQDRIWAVALVGIGLVALAFLYVISQASKPADANAASRSAHTAHRLRTLLFVALLTVFAVGSWATLRPFPIASQRSTSDAQQVVDVTAGQWYWKIDPDTVEVGRPVEFRVTSADVNHGFAIYAPDGHIATQTQAMPGYTNVLRYRFEEPGTYTVQCLEFCGLGHAPMLVTLQVAAPMLQ